MSRTTRTIDDRLFTPFVTDAGWTVSAQADSEGYQCWPKKRFASLEEYDEVEVVIFKDGLALVDPARIGLPPPVLDKFTRPGDAGPAIGCRLTARELAAVREAVMMAASDPNAGVPKGTVGWSGAEIWHGTDQESAQDILDNGIRMEASDAGYFGRAFYATSDRALAASNYAGFSDDGPGALVRMRLAEGARVLDLRNPEDFEEWKPYADFISDPRFDMRMRRAGIDAVHDRSFGGFAIYRADAVSLIDVSPLGDERSPSP